jgi:NCAIR mutase (PurE)-related protein
MNEEEIRKLLESVSQGNLSIEEALSGLKSGPFRNESLSHLNLDHHRRLRQGFSEVILCEFKTTEQVLDIAERVSKETYPSLFTRLLPEQYEAAQKKFPEARFSKLGRTMIINSPKVKDSSANEPYVALISAGTSDIPVIEEAAEVCVAMNVAHEKRNDIGVAGLHRMLSHLEMIQEASAVIVVAGMEGALPSVIGGLVSSPVFAVPTSVGYGVSFQGVTALLSMLSSCAPGVTVSNIDNGFSAGFTACQVIKEILEYSKKD